MESKLIPRTSIVIFASMDRLSKRCFGWNGRNNFIWQDRDQVESRLQMTGYTNDMEKMFNWAYKRNRLML